MTKQYGYAGKILRVDLSSGSTSLIPTMDYADRFLGGRGIAAKIYWDEVSPEIGPFDPENRLIFILGPLAGFPGLTGSRWMVCGKSPGTTGFLYSNFGGGWGAQLKLAGYDGIVIQGKSDKPVYLFIQDDVIEIRDATDLWGKGTGEVREALKSELGSKVAVAVCGPAGENMVTFAGIFADNDAGGQGGFGSVMGSKKLKAVAVRGSGKVTAADPEKLEELRRYVRELRRDILPLADKAQLIGNVKKDVCYGCAGGCLRAMRIGEDGTKHKAFCAGPVICRILAMFYYGDLSEPPLSEIPLQYSKMIDEYGLDLYGFFVIAFWLSMCNVTGILTEEDTGIPLSKFGSREFVEGIIKKVSFREGFGDILAGGLNRAAEAVGAEAKAIINTLPYVPTKDGRISSYDPRLHIPHQLIYATEPTSSPCLVHEMSHTLFQWLYWANKTYGTPITEDFVPPEDPHISTDVYKGIARKFWGSELAVDFTTYEGKALAAKKIQDRVYAKESLILCDWHWPILHTSTGDHIGDPTVESKVTSAVTGNELDEEGLNLIGERVFNLQRAILTREGRRGRESDILPEAFHIVPLQTDVYNPQVMAPGKDGEVISKEGEVVDREKFENMKSEYYQLRGWDVATGLQTKTKLIELGLEDIAEDLEQRGLLV